jgi:hypothetical protein
MSGMSPNGERRQHVRVDRFELFKARRRYGLSSPEWDCLLALTFGADYKTARWTGTYGELAEDLCMGRKTVAAAVARLSDLGVAPVLRPFGPKRTGVVLVAIYADLVALSPRDEAALGVNMRIALGDAISEEGNASSDAISEVGDGVDIASQSRRNRVAIASPDAFAAQPPAQTRAPQGSKEEEGSNGARPARTGEEDDAPFGQPEQSSVPTVDDQLRDRPTVGGLRRSGKAKDPRRFRGPR